MFKKGPMVSGLYRFRVQGLALRVYVGFRIYSLGFKGVSFQLGLTVEGSGFGAHCLGSGSGIRV